MTTEHDDSGLMAGSIASITGRRPELRQFERRQRVGRHTEIAVELFISLNTMKTHVRSLYRRLGVTSRSQAVAAGRARGVL